MKFKLKHYFLLLTTLMIISFALLVVFYSCPKVVFLQSRAELELIDNEYEQFKNGLIIETSNLNLALKLASLKNCKLLLSPIAEEQFDINVPYYTYSNVKKDLDNCFYLDFQAFLHKLEHLAIFENKFLPILKNNDDKSFKLISYEDRISQYDINSFQEKLKRSGCKNVLLFSLGDTKEILSLDEFNFIIPKGGDEVYKKSNIFTYAPDFDAIFKALKSGSNEKIGYKIHPSLK